jgi:glutathione S-transferase
MAIASQDTSMQGVFRGVAAAGQRSGSRGEAISSVFFIASILHPARTTDAGHVLKVWTVTEQRSAHREWMLRRHSIAEIHLCRLYWRLANSFQPAPGAFPNLTAHHQRMMSRPGAHRTLEIEAAIGHELRAWAVHRR